MNKFNIVGIFLFLPIFCSKGRKVFLVRSGLGGEEGDANGTELRYATHKQTDPGHFSNLVFPTRIVIVYLYSEVLPYLNVLKSDDGILRLKDSYFNEDYSEKKSVPENIVKIRRTGKERLTRRTLHRRRMKKKIQRVS